ncbi:MAG: lysophospholipid acyltransferase family protein [Proteobacteria bacterium]|nr:lysophospholipid acyltransferase family protein [Pseudomonadota bacterium]
MKAFKYLRGVLIFGGLCVILLLINVLQGLTSPLYFLDKSKFVQLNMKFKHFFGACVCYGSVSCGNRLEISGDTIEPVSSLIMANHQSYLDIPIIWMIVHPRGMSGWINWFAKYSLKFIPGVGWGLQFSQAILLKRNWAKDVHTITKTFKTLLDANVPFLAVIFPEGTRMKPSKYAASQEYARRKGTYKFQRVLVPRSKGVWATVQGLGSRMICIYDINIAFGQLPPKPLNFFTEGNYTVKVFVTKILKENLPTNEKDFNEWIVQRFIEKDRWMQQHSGYDPALIF